MKTTSLVAALIAVFSFGTSVQATTMEHITARIALGSDADISGFTGFFSNGIVPPLSSHTNTLSFDDGVVKVDFQLTIEGFDENGPADLNPIPTAVGIQGSGDLGGEIDRIDAGEKIKVTIDDVKFTVIGAPPVGTVVDMSSFEALISSIRLSSFDKDTDTFTYSGIGETSVVVDNTTNGFSIIDFVPDQTIDTDDMIDDMFMIRADSGMFRGLFISLSGNYKTIIPEPATFGLLAISLVGIVASRRRR